MTAADPRRSHRRRAVGALAMMLIAVACGGGGDGSNDRDQTTATPTTPSTPTAPITGAPTTSSVTSTMTSTPTTTTPTTTTPTATTPTTSTPTTMIPTTMPPTSTPAPTGVATIHWIGGSDVVLEDRDLPGAVGARLGSIGDRPLDFVADTMIAPRVPDVAARVATAADSGAAGLIVALNPSWLHWDGEACEGLATNYDRYACLMTPVSTEATAANAAGLRDLIDAIVATGLPAYLYTIPHSTNALADPRTADPIAAAESAMLAFDPGVDRIEVVPIFNRGLDGMAEGDGFINIVHPSVAGVARLADWLAADLARFWADAGL